MEVKCKNCGQSHNIDDKTIQNKKVFFFCTKCNQKVTIDARKNVSEEKEEQTTVKEVPSFTSLYKGFKFGFFPSTIITSVIFFLISILSLSVLGLVFHKFSQFFYEHKIITIISAFLVFGFSLFFYNIINYFISKIVLFKQRNKNKSLDFNLITYDFVDDVKAIFLHPFLNIEYAIFVLAVLYDSRT